MKTMEIRESMVSPKLKYKMAKESNSKLYLDTFKIPKYDFTFLIKSKYFSDHLNDKKVFGLHINLSIICILCAIFSGSCFYMFLFYFNPFVGIYPLISSNWRFQISVLTLLPFAFIEFKVNKLLIINKLNLNNILAIWSISICQTIYSTLYSSSYSMTTFAHSGIISSTSVFVIFCFNKYFLLNKKIHTEKFYCRR